MNYPAPIYYCSAKLRHHDPVVHLAYKYAKSSFFLHVICEGRRNPPQITNLTNRIPTCILCLYGLYRLDRAGHFGTRVDPG